MAEFCITPTALDADGATRRYTQRVRLDDEDWLFEFIYSERRDRWTFSIQSLDGADVLTGQLVCCGVPLLSRAVGGPAGQLYAVSEVTTNAAAPGLLELGARVKLWWFDAASAAEVGLVRG